MKDNNAQRVVQLDAIRKSGGNKASRADVSSDGALEKREADSCLAELRAANPVLFDCIAKAESLEKARDAVYSYLERVERDIFDVDNTTYILEKTTIRECIATFKSIIGPVNEKHTGVSALDILWKAMGDRRGEMSQDVAMGFFMEFVHLFRGVAGRSGIYAGSEKAAVEVPDFLRLEGREAAEARTVFLDKIEAGVQQYLQRYPSGLNNEVIERRNENRKRILRYFGGSESDWHDHIWQIRHVIRDVKPLNDLIELSIRHQIATRNAVEEKIPFGITPYYLSLMDRQLSLGLDGAVRAQVIPTPGYVVQVAKHRFDRSVVLDFMGEHATSPVDLVTRRYPGIAILKPFNTCAQICVYCQRNWEIDQVMAPGAMASREKITAALAWFDQHKEVGDVLVTGGDPCVMSDKSLQWILRELAGREHIYRIRIGTRTPVVLPMRWTDSLIGVLSEFHVPGRREIAIVTHFEHPYEITPEAMQAVQKIRQAGMGVYNQLVFTIENSRRFETAKLRLDLRRIGVDPYYTFNLKGKEETSRYRVPIARLLQEAKEEARLLPGLDRTDEPVFNVPRLGKNNLQAWQDHRIIMIMPDGSRVYEFHPWEKYITPVPPYNYTDKPIHDYLEELAARGEDVSEYRTIWYYY